MDNETVRFIGFTYFEQDGRALNHHEQEGATSSPFSIEISHVAQACGEDE